MILDTDVIIWAFRKNEKANKLLLDNIFSISAITYMELLQGAKSKQELNAIKRFLKVFDVKVLPNYRKYFFKSNGLY